MAVFKHPIALSTFGTEGSPAPVEPIAPDDVAATLADVPLNSAAHGIVEKAS